MAGEIKNAEPTRSQPLSKRMKLLTTSAIFLGNIGFGCSFGAFGPALDNIASRYGTTIEDIAVVFTLTSILYCIGATLCGLLANHVNRQLVVVISLFGIASSILITPHCPTKVLFFIAGGALGFFTGIYSSSQVVWIIEIWQAKAGPFIQAQHFCFSFGTIIPSVVLAPFINRNNQSDGEWSSIHIPFLIIGSLNSLAFLYQLFLFVFYRYHTPPMYANIKPVDDARNNPLDAEADLSEKVPLKQQELDNDKVKRGTSTRKIQLVAFAMLFVGAYQAMELSTLQFLPVFGQYSDLKLTQSDAAHVLTGLTILYAAGRLLGIIIIFKVRAELIIIVNLILITTGNTILLVWASDSVTMFWIGSMILGAGFSTTFPSFFAFIEKHLIISGMFASGAMVCGTTVAGIYPIILGKTMSHTAVALSYTNYASTVACLIAMIWGYTLTRKSVTRE